jgi:hypothetical protein
LIVACRNTRPEPTHEYVDDLDAWLIHAAIEMVEEHLFGERGAFAQAQEFQHWYSLAV